MCDKLEIPSLSEEGETKKDPFTEFFDGQDGTLTEELLPDQVEDGTLTEELLPDQVEDGTLTEELLQELIEMQQTETTTSAVVDAEIFNAAINNQTVELSSVMIFCAFLVAGTMAAIKLWSVRL